MFLSKVSLKNFSSHVQGERAHHISFGLVGSSAISGQSFVVGRLLNQKQLDTKGFMATMTFVWDLRYLSIRPVGDRFLLTFSREADCGFMLYVPSRSLRWQRRSDQGRHSRRLTVDPPSIMILVISNLLSLTLSISCDFPTWVEILGLPPRLMTEEAVEKIGSNLGDVIHPDKNNIRLGLKARSSPYLIVLVLSLSLLVSPRKKCKVGRPVGSKLAASSMKKTRHFSTRCSLEMGDGSFGTITSVEDTSGRSATADSRE
ncbi:hypothetical protein ACLB2K_011543 [Fragaria x ananassa]